MKKLLILAALTLSIVPLINTTAKAADETVVAIAAGNADFSTLVAAVKAADLVETLSGAGPFTVFAPTNAAFDKLPKGAVEDLLKPENKAKLAAILTYHVVAGKVMAADVKTGMVKTVQGTDLDVKVSADGVTVNDAKVVKTDIVGSNGVIHVIDTVVLPK
ncbi:MAG: fasciclin domain-containing protein [Verrucomicrobiaceae bacterium]|nr:fasciclin domain-containing protein [Verrucomicrobiaceae bacterium]